MQATQPNAAHAGPAAVLNQTRLDSTDDNLRMPLLLFTDDEADTLVYINPAPQQVSSSVSHRWDFGPPQVESQVIPHRVHSRKLLATGSEALKDQFRPRNQARVRKRYGLTNDMRPGVKYAIDLTPPTEGEEAVIFMTELSCPMGVREWYRKQSRWALPLSCVGGQDEREWIETEWPQANDDSSTQEPVAVQSSDDTESPVEANMKKRRAKIEASNENINGIHRKMNWQGNLPTLRPGLLPFELPAYWESGDAIDLPPFKQDLDPFKKKSIRVLGLPLEYSPVRHRTCLERIMHAIEGLDPKLDTAPKLWTYFALAKVLQVSKFPAVGDHILAWLYNQSNTTFVEVNPELAYQIACGLQNRHLSQTSFAILVGEESLLVLASLIDGKIPKRQTLTLHGRTRESLDDSEVQRVEYASKVFLDRILRIFVDLAGTRMEWVEKLVENCLRKRLSDLSTYRTSIDELIEVCKLYVRAQIYQTLVDPIIPSKDFKVKYVSDDPLVYPGAEYSNSYIVMPRFCRVLTRTFWKSLATGLPELSKLQNWHHLSLWNLAPAIPNLEDEKTAFFQCVPKHEVRQAIYKLRLEVNEAVFDFSVFQLDVQVHIASVASLVTSTPKYEMDEFYVPFDIVDSLVCLQEDEFKFLPLWAGGNDDGSGGVFDDQSVPILENGGFATAGPSVHLDRGQGFPDDIASLDSFESIRPDEAACTIQRASHEATDSHATTVVSVATSVSSEFELVGGVETMELRSVNDSCSVVDGDGDTIIDALLHDDAESDSFEDEFGCDDDDDDDDDQMI